MVKVSLKKTPENTKAKKKAWDYFILFHDNLEKATTMPLKLHY